MPRRPRPRPPAPGSQPLRNIAARPLSNSTSERSNDDALSLPQKGLPDASSSETNGCTAPFCASRSCNLDSHRHYARSRGDGSVRRRAKQRPAVKARQPMGFDLRITLQLTTNFSLPVKTWDDLRSSELLRKFFLHDFDQLCVIYGSTSNDKVKPLIFHQALQDPLYCLAAIAQAHLTYINCLKPTAADDKHLSISQLYIPLLELVRESINDFDEANCESILFAIVLLCEYDLKFSQYEALRWHRLGLQSISMKRGGLHYLGRALPYVLHADRMIAFYLREKPCLMSQLDLSDQYTTQIQGLLGIRASRFSQCKSFELHTIQKLCTDSANFLRLMDHFAIDLNGTSSNIHYERFYFLREQIQIRQCLANADECVNSSDAPFDFMALTATQIMLHYVCEANYLPFFTKILSDRLWNILSEALDLAHEDMESADAKIELWKHDISFLFWLLFVILLPYHRATDRVACSSSKPYAELLYQPGVYTLAICVTRRLFGAMPSKIHSEDKEILVKALEDWMWPRERLNHEFEGIYSALQDRNDLYA